MWSERLRAKSLRDAMVTTAELTKAKKVHEVEIALQLSVMKPTHVR